MQASQTDFPKVLFVNDFAPESLHVADILCRQLFLGYPPERIAWWYWRAEASRDSHDLKVGSRHYWPLPQRLIPNRRFTLTKGALMERICVPLAARHLRRTISEVKPDVVWLLAFSWPILVARKAIPLKGPRLHVSLWDMPDTKPQRAILGDARARRMLDTVYELIARAGSCDGISKAVLEEIESHTGRKDALHVHSGFEPHQLRALECASTTASEDGVVRLAYVGTIISEATFANFLAALDKVRRSLNRKLILEFFGARNYRSRAWFNPEWMIEHGIFSDQGLVESLQRCDWGIVVMDVEGGDLRYSRFSFPNKIGTYLSAGVPVLGYGHPQSSLGEVMKAQPVGRFTSATDADALEKFLRKNLQLPGPRNFFRQEILACARREFDAEQIRSRLWQAWGHRPAR